MKYLPTLIAMAFLASLPTLRARPVMEYSVDSVAGIVSELNKDQYEEPVKEWLRINRPAQYAKLFGDKSNEEENETDQPESNGFFSALGELNAALADSQTFLIDYYINSKAKEGWIVVSLTDTMILFRREPEIKSEQKAAPDKP